MTEDIQKAIRDLEEELGFELRGFADGTIAVPERLRFNVKKLKTYLDWALKVQDQNIKGMFVA